MPSTSKQSGRQTDVMSDIEKLDMLETFPENNLGEQQNTSGIDTDLESRRQHRNVILAGNIFRSLLNTNESDNSGITALTCRAVNSEV